MPTDDPSAPEATASRSVGSQPGESRALLAGIVGTTASVMPAFLTGAVAVQLADDIGLDDRGLGFVMGGFFASAALGSALLGRLAERLGGVRAMRLGLAITMTLGLALATSVRSPLTLGVLLLIAGSANSLTQPAANLLLVERMRASRMGFAFALKQAGMPMSTLVGGALVPAVAVTVGWRWTYVVASALASIALFTLPPATPPGGLDAAPVGDRIGGDRSPGAPRGKPDLPLPILATYGVVGLLAAATAGALTAFLVTAAEGAGIAEGPAGLLLSAGSVIGITSRIVHGRLADGPRLLPIRRVALLLTIGGAAFAVLAFDAPSTYLLGLAPVFGAGWAWPGLFNLSVVRNNPSAPAAATGISQTGIYIGAASGPIVGGVIATSFGYPTLWATCAVTAIAAAGLAMGLRVLLRRHRRPAAPSSPASS